MKAILTRVQDPCILSKITSVYILQKHTISGTKNICPISYLKPGPAQTAPEK